MKSMGNVLKWNEIVRGTVIKAARVENREGNHFKYYEVALEQMKNDTFVIRTFWGKIGHEPLGTQVKDAKESVVDSLAVFHDWLIEKETKKGYRDHGTDPKYASART